MTDSHAHLDLPAFDPDRMDALRRARVAGVEAVVSIGMMDPAEFWRPTFALVDGPAPGLGLRAAQGRSTGRRPRRRSPATTSPQIDEPYRRYPSAPVSNPAAARPMTDSHAHLDLPAFDPDRRDTPRARAAGIETVVPIGMMDPEESWRRTFAVVDALHPDLDSARLKEIYREALSAALPGDSPEPADPRRNPAAPVSNSAAAVPMTDSPTHFDLEALDPARRNPFRCAARREMPEGALRGTLRGRLRGVSVGAPRPRPPRGALRPQRFPAALHPHPSAVPLSSDR